MPFEIGCVTVKLTDSNNGTVYWRGCNIEGLQQWDDGCSDGCLVNGQHGCKKTCFGNNCNDDILMESTGKVSS